MAMTPVGLLRKIGKFVRGGVTPSQVFIGFLLGILIGMTPGFNLTLLIGIGLVILLNANGGMVGLGFALGKVLCLILAPVTFEIGYFLIHRAGLEGLFRAAGDTPVVALMDLHHYCVTGGLALGLVVGTVGGVILGHVINGLRKGIAAAGGHGEKLQKLLANKPVRLVMRIVFGKQKGALGDMVQRKSPLIRKSGVAVCVVIVLLLAAGQFLLVDVFFKDALRRGMEAAVGAEVNIDEADLSVFAGRLEVRGLAVTDPGKPTHNLVQAKALAGDVSISGLLTKRLIIERLQIDDVRNDAERESPGEVFEKAPRPEAELPDDALSEYFEKAEKLREWLGKLKEYLDQRDPNEPAGPTPEEIEKERRRLRDLARAQGYFALSAQEILSKHPAWVIRELEVRPLRVPQIADPLTVRGRELSSAPQLHDKPAKLTVTAGDKTILSAALNFQKPGGEHHVSLHTPPVPIGDVGLSDKAGVDVSEGTAEIQVADGIFTNRRVRQLPFTVKMSGLKAGSREGEGILGLDPQASSEAMKHLKSITLAGALEGRLDAPRLKLDEKAILGALKDALVGAGKAELARRADEQIKKLGSELTGKVGGEAGKTIQDAAGGLLKGVLGGEKPKDPNSAKPEKKTGAGLLDGLFK